MYFDNDTIFVICSDHPVKFTERSQPGVQIPSFSYCGYFEHLYAFPRPAFCFHFSLPEVGRMSFLEDCPFKESLPTLSLDIINNKMFCRMQLVALYILHYWPHFFLGSSWAASGIYSYSEVVCVYVNVFLHNIKMWVIVTIEAQKKNTNACIL